MDERTLKIKELFSDEAFVKALAETENVEAAQKLVADKGVEMSTGELEIMAEMLGDVNDGKLDAEQLRKLAEGGELSEDDLENVAGGNIMQNFTDLFKTYVTNYNSAGKAIGQTLQVSGSRVAAGIGVGVAAIATVGALGYGVYEAVRRRW